MIEFIQDALTKAGTSEIALGLIISTCLGGMMYCLKNLPVKLFYLIVDSLTLTITVVQENNNEAYATLEHELSGKKLYYLAGRFHLIFKYFQKQIEVGAGENSTFITKIGNCWVIVNKYTDSQVSFWHSYYYTIRFFTRDKDKIDQFFKRIFKEQNSLSSDDTIKVFQYVDGGWDFSEKRKVDHSIYLSPEKEAVRKRISFFMNNENKYAEKQKPYREGFILSGDPGCGKSYFIMQMASAFDLNIYYLNLKSFSTDSMFIKAMLQVHFPAILLIEDIDCNDMVHSRENRKETIKETLKGIKEKDSEEIKNGVSLSTLLNTFDGILSQEGQITFITTNHLDVLDPALIRAGRFNTNVVFKKLKGSEIVNYINNYYQKNDNFDAGNKEMSIAKLSGMCDIESYETMKAYVASNNRDSS